MALQTQGNNLGLPVATAGSQIVRKDRLSGALTLVSASAAGVPASGSASGQARDASISGDGRYVAFRSFAANLGVPGASSRVFVRDLQTATTSAIPLPAIAGNAAIGCRESSVSSVGSVVLTCFFPTPIRC